MTENTFEKVQKTILQKCKDITMKKIDNMKYEVFAENKKMVTKLLREMDTRHQRQTEFKKKTFAEFYRESK
jgi:hypothetical protein